MESESTPERAMQEPRQEPLGAPDSQDEEQEMCPEDGPYSHHDHCQCVSDKLNSFEEELEQMNSSLFALTTHFAQVQFRLRQIVNAPVSDKEAMLKSLEEFAFQGIPDLEFSSKKLIMASNEQGLKDLLNQRKNEQRELIETLKVQLRDLENYAFEFGDAGIPQDVLLERQKAILDELKMKINLDLDETRFSSEQLRAQVDKALCQFMSPLKMKEYLVNQLKTQVSDLERFIQFLQEDSGSKAKGCTCTVHSSTAPPTARHQGANIARKVSALLHVLAVMQLGCGAAPFRRNEMKSTPKGNHYGDIRARFEMAVNMVVDLVEHSGDGRDSGVYSSDAEDAPSVACNVRLTTAVRKHLALSLRDLMQHGLVPASEEVSLVPLLGCFPKRGSTGAKNMHAWQLIMEYYSLKDGDQFNSTPARKLSQSFNLDIVGSTAISAKKSMLSAIGNIVASHSPYKRSPDSYLKAFVCAGLNAQKLVPWLSLIYQSKTLLQLYYEPWSYARKTGFQDSLQRLDVLTSQKFDLPVDLAIRQFQTIKDVFT